MKDNLSEKKMGKAKRDVFALGIVLTSILLFIGTGSIILPDVANALFGEGAAPNLILIYALLLNVALIIFGWRRYRELTKEITERRQLQAIAQKFAETDPLTGCLNRRSLPKRASDFYEASEKRGEAVASIILDIDNFKRINDMHSHVFGDQLLSEMAQRLRKNLPEGSILARHGGDEFGILVSYPPDSPEQVEELVSSLIRVNNAAMKINDVKIETTLTAGIACNQISGTGHYQQGAGLNAKILLQRADMAMLQAKKRGKNRYSWFAKEMEEDLRFRNELEASIRSGVYKGEFEPYYEQQIDLGSGELRGFEMLARWNSPKLGIVNPDAFISIAEEIGVIDELSEGLIEQALKDASEWDPTLSLSVNISPVQLRDPWFAHKLLKLLIENNFPPERLEIEITENCLHDNVAVVRSILGSLQNQGIKVSLDDFGTGYSSLSQLRSLPFDRIKIDRSFVQELHNTGASSKIIDAIVSLGNGLEMPVTAEGIEDGAILDMLQKFGELKGQGYLYGRPESASQVRKRLQRIGKLQGKSAPADKPKSKHPFLDENELIKLLNKPVTSESGG